MIQSLTDKLNAIEAVNRSAKAWFVEQQRIRRSLAPAVWRSLVGMLEEGVDSLNKETSERIVIETINANEIKLKNAETGAWMLLRYDQETPCVWFTTPGPNGYLPFKVSEDGMSVRLFDTKRDVVMFPDEAATEFLSRLVAKR